MRRAKQPAVGSTIDPRIPASHFDDESERWQIQER